MKELIEEFRLLSTGLHEHHRGEWKDCAYGFCKRRYQLWFAAKVETHTHTEPDCKLCGCTHAAAYELGRQDEKRAQHVEREYWFQKGVARGYRDGVANGIESARMLMAMETSAAPGLPPGLPLTALFPDGMEVTMRGDEVTSVKPPELPTATGQAVARDQEAQREATVMRLREATPEEAAGFLSDERCRFSVSFQPLLQCTLTVGHSGVHVGPTDSLVVDQDAVADNLMNLQFTGPCPKCGCPTLRGQLCADCVAKRAGG